MQVFLTTDMKGEEGVSGLTICGNQCQRNGVQKVKRQLCQEKKEPAP